MNYDSSDFESLTSLIMKAVKSFQSEWFLIIIRNDKGWFSITGEGNVVYPKGKDSSML